MKFKKLNTLSDYDQIKVGNKIYFAEPLNAFEDETPSPDIILEIDYNGNWVDCENGGFSVEDIGECVFFNYEDAYNKLNSK